MAPPAHFPSENMLHWSPCRKQQLPELWTTVPGWVIILSGQALPSDKREQQSRMGDIQRGPNRQTDIDKIQQKPACRTHSPATWNWKFLIMHDAPEPVEAGRGWEGGQRRRLPAAPALARSLLGGAVGPQEPIPHPPKTRSFRRPACLVETPRSSFGKSSVSGHIPVWVITACQP